jgi:electron transfer flavoprotein beta subunit
LMPRGRGGIGKPCHDDGGRPAGLAVFWEEADVEIVVLAKRVPDTAAEKKLDPADKTLDRESVESILNPMDEYALEEALRLKESRGGGDTVTVLLMGPDSAAGAIRKALSMGADRAVHVKDPAIHGSDALATAYVLAQALRRLSADIVLAGAESTDARTSLVPAAVAEFLGLPSLTYAKKVEVGEGTVRVHRETETGYEECEAPLPAVVSVVKGINEPRYPSFKGIMAAKSKPVEALDLAGIGAEASRVGLTGSKTEVLSFQPRPPRQKGEVVKDEGDGGVRLADFLQQRKFI